MRGCFENVLGMAGCGQRTVFSIRITEESGSPWPLPRTRKNACTNKSQGTHAEKRLHQRITEESGSPWPLPRTRKNACTDKPQGTRKNASTNKSPHTAEARIRYL